MPSNLPNLVQEWGNKIDLLYSTFWQAIHSLAFQDKASICTQLSDPQ